MNLQQILGLLAQGGPGTMGQTIPGIGGNVTLPGGGGYGFPGAPQFPGPVINNAVGESSAPSAPSAPAVPKKPGLFDRITSGLLGPSSNYGGLLDHGAQDGARNDGRMALAASLLESSGPSTQRVGLGQALGRSIMAGRGAQNAGLESALQAQLMKARTAQQNSPYGAIQPDKFTPESLAQFEQTHKYSDLKLRPIGMQTGRYNPGDFTPESWAAFLSSNDPAQLVRYVTPQNATIEDLAGGRAIVQPDKTGRTPARITQLTTPQQEQEAAAERKRLESQGGAIGAGAGGVIADIQKKGANAQTINAVLDLADPLIDASTGSLAGAAADKIAGAFGKALSGAEASAQLQVLQAGLMLNQPRMEGPQSDADVKLYQAAAGQIGDPTVPNGTKKAALKIIRQLQQRYVERAKSLNPSPANDDPLGIR